MLKFNLFNFQIKSSLLTICSINVFFFFLSYNHTNHFELDGQINFIFNQSNIEFIYMFYSMYIVGTVLLKPKTSWKAHEM